jgi:hypothetical protein
VFCRACLVGPASAPGAAEQVIVDFEPPTDLYQWEKLRFPDSSSEGHFGKTTDGRTPLGFYCYHADMRGRYGNSWEWLIEDRGRLQHERWYGVEEYCRMNTPGKNDGVLRAWIDGQPAFEKTDIRFRDVPQLRLEKIWFNVYHGGSWVPEDDTHVYFDNVVIARKPIGPITPMSE